MNNKTLESVISDLQSSNGDINYDTTEYISNDAMVVSFWDGRRIMIVQLSDGPKYDCATGKPIK